MVIADLKKTFLFISLLIIFFCPEISRSQPRINIVYPKEGAQVIASDSMFTFGNVWPRSAHVIINNRQAEIYQNGTYLAVVPVHPGNFKLKYLAIYDKDTTETIREIYIPYYLKTSPLDSLTIDTSYVFPRKDWELEPGATIKVAFKGTPGCKATFSIEGIINDFPMIELPPKASYNWGEAVFKQGTNFQMSQVRGIYTGSYIIQPWDWGTNRKIFFILTDSTGYSVKTTAPGKLSINLSTIPKIAEIRQDIIRLRNGPRIGSLLFLPKSAKVKVIARRGNFFHIQYIAKKHLWLKQDYLEILPPGSTLPEGIITQIRTQDQDKWAQVEIHLDQRLPFKISPLYNPTRLELTFYGLTSTSDSILLDLKDKLVKDICSEKAENIYKFTILLNQRHHWGYDPFYKDDHFYLKIKKKPRIAHWPNSPLKNISICLDPGHSPETGAVGPSGIAEKDINFSYCLALKALLEKKGATVVLTRGKEDGVSLASRAQLAKFIEADILISMHFNALPEGVDPFKIRGISTYYNQPHSYRLAYLIQNKLLDETRMPNFGLYYSNLMICRTPQVISVLVEPGFLTHPVEETLIMSEIYKQKVTTAIVKALEQFLKGRR